jgi:pimeloyl-ACP methyl ester carboxylesterase
MKNVAHADGLDVRKLLKTTAWILAALGALIAVTVLGFLGYRSLRLHQNAVAFAIRAPKGIEESSFVRIGGIDQFVLVRGEDRNNPVILMLHGGPGLATSPLFAWYRPWEKHFTIVQWDQRGAGKTYGRYGDATPDLTERRIVEDGIALSAYLCRHLHKKKIVLLGHSWGSELGLRMIAERPDLYAAYVGTGQVVNDAQDETLAYMMILTRARKSGDTKTVALLEKIGRAPYKNADTLLAERQAVAPYSPANEQPGQYLARSIPAAFFAPGFSLKDIWDASFAGFYSLRVLEPAMEHFDAYRLGMKYDVLMFFVQGEQDTVTPTPLVQAFARNISAPYKEVIVLKDDGHGALLTDPDAFLRALLVHVQPRLAAQGLGA